MTWTYTALWANRGHLDRVRRCPGAVDVDHVLIPEGVDVHTPAEVTPNAGFDAELQADVDTARARRLQPQPRRTRNEITGSESGEVKAPDDHALVVTPEASLDIAAGFRAHPNRAGNVQGASRGGGADADRSRGVVHVRSIDAPESIAPRLALGTLGTDVALRTLGTNGTDGTLLAL